MNTGRSTAEKMTGAFQGIFGPELPKWKLSEFSKISGAFGSPEPKRDEFYSTSLEPGMAKSTVLAFPRAGMALKMFGKGYVQKLGVPSSAEGLPVVTPRAFFFGYIDYATLGKTYRLKYCYTPQTYPGTTLIECGQWNGTEEVGVVGVTNSNADTEPRDSSGGWQAARSAQAVNHDRLFTRYARHHGEFSPTGQIVAPVSRCGV